MESPAPAAVVVTPFERALGRHRDVMAALAPAMAVRVQRHLREYMDGLQLDVDTALAAVPCHEMNVHWNRMVPPCSTSSNSR